MRMEGGVHVLIHFATEIYPLDLIIKPVHQSMYTIIPTTSKSKCLIMTQRSQKLRRLQPFGLITNIKQYLADI